MINQPVQKSVQVLEVSNVGPVKSLSIPLPRTGGVVVLKGPNGSGKSTVLEGAKRVLGGESGPLTPTDGAKRGMVSLGDAKLSVTPKRTATSGELEVSSIEGRFDVSDLIDPGIKDPERADVARLKALVSLSGAVADETPYRELVGDELWREMRSLIDTTDDPIRLCSHVKRAVEAGARSWEDAAEMKRVELLTTQKLIDEALGEPQEGAELRAKIDAATDRLAKLKAQQEAYQANLRAAGEAREAMAKADADRQGQPSIAELVSQVDLTREARDAASRLIDRLKAELSAAELDWTRKRSEANAAELRYNDATRHAESVAKLRDIYARPLGDCPSDAEVAEAETAKLAALDAYAANDKRRENSNRRKQAATINESWKARSRKAAELRDLASRVEGVLAGLISAGPIRIEDGRLVVETDRSASELYADLSHGERAKVAIDIAADHLPANGLVVIRQEVWESLQPANRVAVHQHAVTRGVTVLTAAVDDGDGIAIENMEG